MLTPRFHLSQDEDFILVTVHAPYSNIQESECHIEDYDFIFYTTPYFLRLRLPGKLKDSDRCFGTFDCDTQEYYFKIEKENKGLHFENLNMITSLLIPTKSEPTSFTTRIEVIGSSVIGTDDNVTVITNTNSVDTNKIKLVTQIYGYGFGNKYTVEFDCENFLEVFELRTPNSINGMEKTRMRFSYEDEKFSADHYLADLYEPENIISCLNYEASWKKLLKSQTKIYFDVEELDILKELPNKEYLLESDEKQSILVGLADLLYGLMFEYRTTAEDLSSESSWTVNRLSPTLSWFETFNSLEDCMLSSVRRALIYPLYRNFELAVKVKDDVAIALGLGKTYVIKCLIQIHKLFNLSQAARYILNKLYINDYLIFVQKLNDCELASLVTELKNIHIDKIQLGLDLVEIEAAAKLVHDEQDNVDVGLASAMASIGIDSNQKVIYTISSDEDDTDESDTSSSDSSDETDSSSELDSDDSQEPKSENLISYCNSNAHI